MGALVVEAASPTGFVAWGPPAPIKATGATQAVTRARAGDSRFDGQQRFYSLSANRCARDRGDDLLHLTIAPSARFGLLSYGRSSSGCSRDVVEADYGGAAADEKLRATE